MQLLDLLAPNARRLLLVYSGKQPSDLTLLTGVHPDVVDDEAGDGDQQEDDPDAPSATCAMQGALCKAEHALCWLRLRASVVRIGTERELPVRPGRALRTHARRH